MYSLIRPLLFRCDAESVHHAVLGALAHTPIAKIVGPASSRVEDPVELWGLKFRNRIGLAAGMDKNAAALGAWRDLGFGFVEIGTVTRHAQPGNPRPRIFRCPAQQGLVNRMGFPNLGAEAIARHLASSWKPAGRFPVGINLGKSKITELEDAPSDYRFSFEKLYAHGDFFVINVSSPNTPGLRALQQTSALEPIFEALQEFNRGQSNKPLLVKIAPDLALEDIAAVLGLIEKHGLAGIVATNTTLDHSSITLKETGGLSGQPVRARSTEIIRFIAKETAGKLPIVGVGGVFTRADYLEKLEAGATLVQVYTGFVYEGPGMLAKLLANT